jgi:hypothetical protein
MPTPQYARSQSSRDELRGRHSPGWSAPRNTFERGLTKEGLKEVARDVGGAFNAAITGENTSQASKNKGFRQASSDSPKSGQATQSATPQSPAAMKRDQR